MGRIEKIIALSVLVILLLLIVVLMQQSLNTGGQERIYSISVLVEDLSDNQRRGMDKAALVHNVDVHYISGFPGDGKLQTDYLQREISNGVDAVILKAEDAVYMTEWLNQSRTSIPIVCLGDDLTGTEAVRVTPDNLELGKLLGEKICEETLNLPCTVFINAHAQQHLLERREGLAEALESAGRSLECVTISGAKRSLSTALAGRPYGVAVVLDETLLPLLCEEARQGDALYGIGFSGQVRTDLEEGRLNAVAVYSGYDEGYMAMECAANAAGTPPAQDVILSGMLVDASNMYETPQSLVLFPIS